MTDILKEKGVYQLVVRPSDQIKGLDGDPVVVYAVINTETGVREWEDTLLPTACSYLETLADGYEKEFGDSKVISVPNLVIPKGIH